MKARISESCMLAHLSISTWAGRKIDKEVTREVIDSHNAADDAGNFSKQLIKKELIKPISALAAEARQVHYKYTLPWLDDGARILPNANYFEYTQRMQAMSEEFDRLTKEFCAGYENAVHEERQRLGTLYRDDDYPAPEAIAGKFKFGVKMMPVPDAADFRCKINDEVEKEIRKDIEDSVKAASQAAAKDVWDRLYKVIGHFHDRLSKDEGGLKKASNLVGNVRELIDLLPRLNFTGDPELDAIAKAAKEKLYMYESDDLCKQPELRKAAAADAADILAKMAGYCGMAQAA